MRSPSWVRLQRLFLVFLTTKNWLSSILVWIGFYQMKIVVFRNGMQFRLEKSNWVTYLEHVYLFHHFPEAKVFGEFDIKISIWFLTAVDMAGVLS